MKILFISDNFPPEVNAPATRTYEHCMHWIQQGAKVTVITCVPNFPHGKVYEGYRNKLYQKEEMDGIKVIRVWSYIAANKGFSRRIADYLSFSITSLFASLFTKADVIIATSPQFFAAVSGYGASLLKRKPWIMEVRDLWPESIKAVDAMKEESRAIKWLEKLEMHLYRKSDQLVVVTDAFKENISKRGITPGKIQVIKNGVRIERFEPMPKDEAIMKALGLQNKFIIGYIGTHGMAHKLDFILHCANKVNDPDIHFFFIGGGAEKENLLKLKDQLQLKNVTMHDPVPKEEIGRYISIIDAALVPLKKSDTFKTVIPSKIFENAAMEKPILLGVEGESKEIIQSYGAGICFEPENEVEFLDGVQKLRSDKDLYRRCREGCRRMAHDFKRERLADEMLNVIRTVKKA